MKGLRENIVRAWTNEGDISSNERKFVTLDLALKDGDVYGTLSLNTEERLLGAHVGIGWGRATLQVSRFRSRGLQPIATVRLRLSGNRNRLKWKVVKEEEKGVLPAKTLLWPSVVGNRGWPGP